MGQRRGTYAITTSYYDQMDLGLPPPLDGLQPVQRTSGGIPQIAPKSDIVDQWTLPNGNMYNKFGPACTCFSDPNSQPRSPSDPMSDPGDPHPHPDPYPSYNNTLLGPLRHDFPSDSLLIGRERIFVEYVNRT